MDVNGFSFSKQGLRRESDLRPQAGWLDDSLVRWMDVQYDDIEQVIELVSPLGIGAELFEEIEKDEGVKIEVADQAVLLRIPRPALRSESRWAYINAICVAETLITFHPHAGVPFEEIEATLRRRGHGAAGKLAEPLYELLGLLVDQDIIYYQRTRRAVEELSEAVDSIPEDEVASSILELRRQVQHLEEVAEDFATLHLRLLTLRTPLFDLGDLRPFFRESAEGVQHYQRWLERLDSRLQDLHDHYQLRLQTVTNSRLQTLTVLSAIFLPLTLIAGIYGMNFEHMPELQAPYAYFATLAGMGCLGIGLVAFFYVRGWFR